MKDLYTFDITPEAAFETYAHVSGAYKAFFADMKLPVLVAEASSGDMGGNYSHEYHLANPLGEDTVATCSSCGYTANDEVAIPRNADKATRGEGAVAAGDGCPECENGTLEVSKAIELGHTFYLGTRYSEPLEATYSPKGSTHRLPIQMGCYGIGVSRMIGAVAEHIADSKGLTWPRAIAPFEAVVIPTSGVDESAHQFYDELEGARANGSQFDIALDDRNKPFGWKMQDADLIGYPVTIILGKAWRESKTCEIQCRSLSLKQNVAANDVPKFLQQLLHRL
jgi:prolyl-tRNA synthetase